METHLRLMKVSFLVKLKKIDRNELSGLMCTEFQLSISANFRFNFVVNFVKNVE
jgi:hypothetical protein